MYSTEKGAYSRPWLFALEREPVTVLEESSNTHHKVRNASPTIQLCIGEVPVASTAVKLPNDEAKSDTVGLSDTLLLGLAITRREDKIRPPVLSWNDGGKWLFGHEWSDTEAALSNNT